MIPEVPNKSYNEIMQELLAMSSSGKTDEWVASKMDIIRKNTPFLFSILVGFHESLRADIGNNNINSVWLNMVVILSLVEEAYKYQRTDSLIQEVLDHKGDKLV